MKTIQKLRFNVEYYKEDGRLSHSYPERYEYDQSLLCPHCGSRSIWVEDEEDYYQGYRHICVHCGSEFYLSIYPPPVKDAQTKQRLNHLRRLND